MLNIDNLWDRDEHLIVRKKQYTLFLRKAEVGEKIINNLEMCEYVVKRPGELVLRGLFGEEWVASKEAICGNYDITGTELEQVGSEGVYVNTRTNGSIFEALKIPEEYEFEIETDCGDILKGNSRQSVLNHAGGDYLLAEYLETNINPKERKLLSNADADEFAGLDVSAGSVETAGHGALKGRKLRIVNGTVFAATYEVLKVRRPA